jgi:hypothetical protein
MENLMEKGSISGKMALLIMDIFNKEWGKVRDIGIVKMVMNIKVIIVPIVKMVLDNLNGLMEIFIKVNFVKIWEKEMGKCFGVMVVCMKDNGGEDYQMVKVFNLLTK